MHQRLIAASVAVVLAGCGGKRERAPEPQPPPSQPPAVFDAAPAPEPEPEPAGPVVRVHSLEVGGNLGVSQGRAVIDHNLADWRACYATALQSEPALCGHLSVVIEHRRHGGFAHSYPRENTVRSAALSECLSFDLRAPSKALAAPGTTYRLVLVFAPAADQVAACSPQPSEAPTELPAMDRACTTDADCAAIYQRYVSDGACCHSCNTAAVAASSVPAANTACSRMGSEGCPVKKCAALAPVACVAGQCAVKDAEDD